MFKWHICPQCKTRQRVVSTHEGTRTTVLHCGHLLVGGVLAQAAPLPDVIVENHGTLFMFRPRTTAAREFVEKHVRLESWQWQGDGFAVDHRYATRLAQGMIDDGLVVQ